MSPFMAIFAKQWVFQTSVFVHNMTWKGTETLQDFSSKLRIDRGRKHIKVENSCSEKIMYQSIPKPPIPPRRAIPGHLTRVKLRTVGNLTQNEPARWGIWLSRQNVCQWSWSKRIFQFFDSAGEPRSRVIALVGSTWVFLLLSFYIVLSWKMPLFKVWSEDKLNKKFVVAENIAELVSTVCFTCLEGGGFDPLWSSNGWGIWPSKLAT